METAGRTPRGVRGLKLPCWQLKGGEIVSHPSRGAWIEIFTGINDVYESFSRTPRGVRGLKLFVLVTHIRVDAVAPLAGCVD